MRNEDSGRVNASDAPLKIAVWVKVFPPRYETFIVNQIAGLLESGHTVDVIAGRRAGDIPGLSDTVKTILPHVRFRSRIPAGRAGRLVRLAVLAGQHLCSRRKASRSLVRKVRIGGRDTRLLYAAEPFRERCRYDIIHCQYGPLGATAVRLRSMGLLQGRIVTSFRGYDVSSVENHIDDYRELFSQGDLFLPVSQYFRQRLIALGCDKGRVRVHRSGIDCRAIESQSRLTSFAAGISTTDSATTTDKAPRSEPETRPRLISVGRLVEKKGLEYAIRALARLIQYQPGLVYEIIGDGPLRDQLQTLAVRLGIDGHVTFTGWLPHEQVLQRLRTADVFVLPSVTAESGAQEGIPNSVKEAMVLGLPVVSTHHSGIPELVEDGVTGLLVAERDHMALADSIQRLLVEPSASAPLITAAQRLVTYNYDTARLCRELQQLYRRVVAGELQAR